MRRQSSAIRGACALVVLVTGVVSAQTAPPGSASQATPATAAGRAEQQLREAHRQLVDAGRQDDKETARRLMAEDMTWVKPTGEVSNREELLSGPATPPREVAIEQLRTFGSAAIVSGSAHFDDGREARFLQEWVNRDGQWRLFAHQATAVTPEPAAGQAGVPPPAGTSGSSPTSGSAPSLNTDEERAVWNAQMALQRAFLAGDTAAYSTMTLDEFVRVAPNGQRQGKGQYLQNVKQNANQSAGQLDTGDVQLAVNDDTARVVMRTWGTLPGGQPVPPLRVTRVFVKRDGQWRQAAAIFTPILK